MASTATAVVATATTTTTTTTTTADKDDDTAVAAVPGPKWLVVSGQHRAEARRWYLTHCRHHDYTQDEAQSSWVALHWGPIEPHTIPDQLDWIVSLFDELLIPFHARHERTVGVATYYLRVMLNAGLREWLNTPLPIDKIRYHGREYATPLAMLCWSDSVFARCMLGLEPECGLDVSASTPECEPALCWALTGNDAVAHSTDVTSVLIARSNDAVINGTAAGVTVPPLALAARQAIRMSIAYLGVGVFSECLARVVDDGSDIVLDDDTVRYINYVIDQSIESHPYERWACTHAAAYLRATLNNVFEGVKTYQVKFDALARPVIDEYIPVPAVANVIEAYALRRKLPVPQHYVALYRAWLSLWN